MKVFPMLLVLATAVFVSCERHDWEETKVIHEKHGHGEHKEHGEHAAGEEAHGEPAKEGEHGKEAEHGH